MPTVSDANYFDSIPVRVTKASLEAAALVDTRDVETTRRDSLIDELLRIRNLPADWDGAGCAAPDVDTVDNAIRWIEFTLRRGGDLPSYVVPGVNGDVVFYWQQPGYLVEAIFMKGRLIEWMEKRGNQFTHFETNDTAVICIK